MVDRQTFNFMFHVFLKLEPLIPHQLTLVWSSMPMKETTKLKLSQPWFWGVLDPSKARSSPNLNLQERLWRRRGPKTASGGPGAADTQADDGNTQVGQPDVIRL